MTLRLGIIGCGAIAEEMHIPSALALSGISLAALVDVDSRRAEQLASKFRVPDVAVALEDVARNLDAVIISTPPNPHRELAEKAFGLGLHVLAEKPLANTRSDCEAMVAAARSSKRVLAVGHMFRFYPVRRDLRDLIKLHGLGRIKEVVATEGQPYSWQTRTGYTVRRECVTGGVVLNAGVHTLDTLISAFGDPVESDYEDDAIGGLESNARIVLRFDGGFVARYRISRTCRLPYSLRVVCEQGTLEFSLRAVSEYRVISDISVEDFTCDGPPLMPMDCWKLQLADFAASIRDQREPLVNGEEGSRVVALIEQLYQSKKTRPLPVMAPLPGVTW